MARQDKLKGGEGDNTRVSDVDPKEFKIGVAVEKEHTDKVSTAIEIALDHLTEDPHYYTKLMKADLVDEPEAQKVAEVGGMGYPSGPELKKHLRKLKKIRKDLNSDKFDRMSEVPDYMKTPVKKMFKKRLEAGTKEDPDKSILYYHRRVEDIMPDDIFIKLSEEDNTIFMKFPPHYRSKSYEKGKEKIKKDTDDRGKVDRDVHGTDRVSDLSFKTPEDALDSIKKVKMAKIDNAGRIKSLLPNLNRLPSTIKRTKDPKKRSNLLKSLKILQKYYNDIKGLGGNNDEDDEEN